VAEGKVASIGTVNPRPPGLLNSIAQGVKRLVARALHWHVREQVEFNRAVIACVQSTLEALNDCNRAIAALSARIEEFRDDAQQLKDIRTHWAEWRVEWENKLAAGEIQFLRSVAELQAAFQHRVTLMDANYRDQVKAQHADFEKALERAAGNIQQRLSADLEAMHQRFWEDMRQVRTEYEAIIHAELRLLRQKASLTTTVRRVVEDAPNEFENIDWLKHAEKFRGSEAAVKERQQ